MAALAGMACRAQEPRPEGGVRILTAGQHITPYRIGVPFSKTVHILFPSEVRYVDLGSTDIIAGKADGVENVVRVKAAVRDFPGETNFSVITGDGSFYSFLVSYDEETEALNINMDSRFPAEPSTEGSAVRVTELGEEDPSVIASLMYTVHRLDRRDVKHIGCRQFGMQALLKGIYVHKDLLFLHISLANSSHVPFDIDFVRFKVVDKKVAKRTAQQETYIEPVRTLNELRRIGGKGEGRIVYAFHKVVIPDDKLIKKGQEEGTSMKEVAQRFEAEYLKDAAGLNCKKPTVQPRATEHIQQILDIVKDLIDSGHAYVAKNGDVYFRVKSDPEYGKLSHLKLDDLESGNRELRSQMEDDLKEDPADFAVWKAAKPGEPAWESPYGMGRPGWHIECSAMSRTHLGKTIDLHCGGQDLIFPHHENEIAQSECANGCEFARYWMHNGFINVDNQKMSKSLHNFFTVRDVADLSLIHI